MLLTSRFQSGLSIAFSDSTETVSSAELFAGDLGLMLFLNGLAGVAWCFVLTVATCSSTWARGCFRARLRSPAGTCDCAAGDESELCIGTALSDVRDRVRSVGS
jgi:hypothetical protein